MIENLIEVCNSKGYVLRNIGEWNDNKFGKTHIVTIETSEQRITFITNVLHGVNYFKIQQLYDTYKERNYKAQRYFHKLIPLISDINGKTHILNKNM